MARMMIERRERICGFGRPWLRRKSDCSDTRMGLGEHAGCRAPRRSDGREEKVGPTECRERQGETRPGGDVLDEEDGGRRRKKETEAKQNDNDDPGRKRRSP